MAGAVRIPFPAGIWIQVEIKIGIVCACLPTLPPLFRRLRSKFSGAGSSERSASSGEKGGVDVAVVEAGNGDVSPIRDGKGKKPKGWYSQVLNSFSNKGAEEQSECREEIMELRERKLSDEESV